MKGYVSLNRIAIILVGVVVVSQVLVRFGNGFLAESVPLLERRITCSLYNNNLLSVLVVRLVGYLVEWRYRITFT